MEQVTDVNALAVGLTKQKLSEITIYLPDGMGEIPDSQVYSTKRESYEFPCAEITRPVGVVSDVGSESITATMEFWVIITDRDEDSDILESRMNSYLSAMMKLFRLIEEGWWSMELSGWDSSPPGSDVSESNIWVQTVGVRVHLTLSVNL